MEAGHGSGYADRLVADVVDPAVENVAVSISRLADEDRLPLVLARSRARGRVELEQRIRALRAVHEHRAAAADPTHLRIDDSLHECACDGRIDRVATAPHDVETYLGSQRLRTHDHSHAANLARSSGPRACDSKRARTHEHRAFYAARERKAAGPVPRRSGHHFAGRAVAGTRRHRSRPLVLLP